MSGVIRTVPCGCESGQPCTPATRCAITTAVHIQREDDEAEMERLREDHEAELAALRAEKVSQCGHPSSLMLRSAEAGKVLYCELCDERKRRRDAESMEEHYKARAEKAEAERDAGMVAVKAMHKLLDRDWAIVDRDITLRCESHDQAWNYLHEMRDLVRAALGER